MVPTAVVPLESLPMLPNGKIDRKALAALEWVAAGGGEEAAGEEDSGAHDEVRARLLGGCWAQGAPV